MSCILRGWKVPVRSEFGIHKKNKMNISELYIDSEIIDFIYIELHLTLQCLMRATLSLHSRETKFQIEEVTGLCDAPESRAEQACASALARAPDTSQALTAARLTLCRKCPKGCWPTGRLRK